MKKVYSSLTGNIRCVLCDRVSAGEIAEHEDDVYYNHFYYQQSYGDSGVSAYICHQCQAVDEEVRSEWSMIDDLEEDEFYEYDED